MECWGEGALGDAPSLDVLEGKLMDEVVTTKHWMLIVFFTFTILFASRGQPLFRLSTHPPEVQSRNSKSPTSSQIGSNSRVEVG